MATLRSDIIIPEIFTPYFLEQTSLRDAFLAIGCCSTDGGVECF
jgi:hypothetical protein